MFNIVLFSSFPPLLFIVVFLFFVISSISHSLIPIKNSVFVFLVATPFYSLFNSIFTPSILLPYFLIFFLSLYSPFSYLFTLFISSFPHFISSFLTLSCDSSCISLPPRLLFSHFTPSCSLYLTQFFSPSSTF